MGNCARNVRLGSYDGTWYTECNGTTFVTVYKILMKWGPFFVCHDNIWQTIIVYKGVGMPTQAHCSMATENR